MAGGSNIRNPGPNYQTPESNVSGPKPRLEGTSLLYPMSFGQEQIWIREMQMQLSHHNENAWFTIDFPLHFELSTLEKGLNYFFDQNEVWRYRLDTDGNAGLLYPSDFSVHLDFVDLSHLGLSEGLKESLIVGHSKNRSTNFLSTAELIRFILFNLEGGYTRLYVFAHIIAMDETFCDIVGEIIASYKAIRSQEDPKLHGLTVHDWEYSLWLKHGVQIDFDAVADLENYWVKFTENFDALALPSDKENNKDLEDIPDHMKTRSFVLSRKLYGLIEKFQEKEKLGQFDVLIATWKVLLFRYTQQKTLIHSIQTDRNTFPLRKNRPTQHLIGHHLNTTVAKVTFAKPKFLTFLKQVGLALNEGFEHQEFPFNRIIELSCKGYGLKEIKREILSTGIQLFTLPGKSTDKPKLLINPLDYAHGFDMVLSLVKRDSEFQISLSYNAKYFGEDRIHALIRHYKVMLENFLEKPLIGIHVVQMMSPQEQEYIIRQYCTGPNTM